MLGRRGPAQAAFTSAELRELGRLDGVDAARGPGRGRARPAVRASGSPRRAPSPRARTSSCCASSPAREPRPDAPRAGSSCASCARRSRSAATGRVEAIDVRRNEIVRARRRLAARRARRTTSVETIECGLVLRSVGYRAVPLPDVPFDERQLRAAQRPRPGARRPTASRSPASTPSAGSSAARPGILGTNKRDAEETVALPRRGPRRGRAARRRPTPAASRSTRCSPSASPTLVTVDGWRAIDARELEAGLQQERPRVKLASRDELLAAAGAGSSEL